MLFRLARREDIDAVAALYEAAKGDRFCAWTEGYPTAADALSDFTHGCLYVLEEEGCVIGCLSAEHENEMDGYPHWTRSGVELARLTVARAHRGRGLAGYMMGEMIHCLRGRTPSLHLAASVINLPAYRTYERLGFRTLGQLDIYEGSYYMMEYDYSLEGGNEAGT